MLYESSDQVDVGGSRNEVRGLIFSHHLTHHGNLLTLNSVTFFRVSQLSGLTSTRYKYFTRCVSPSHQLKSADPHLPVLEHRLLADHHLPRSLLVLLRFQKTASSGLGISTKKPQIVFSYHPQGLSSLSQLVDSQQLAILGRWLPGSQASVGLLGGMSGCHIGHILRARIDSGLP